MSGYMSTSMYLYMSMYKKSIFSVAARLSLVGGTNGFFAPATQKKCATVLPFAAVLWPQWPFLENELKRKPSRRLSLSCRHEACFFCFRMCLQSGDRDLAAVLVYDFAFCSFVLLSETEFVYSGSCSHRRLPERDVLPPGPLSTCRKSNAWTCALGVGCFPVCHLARCPGFWAPGLGRYAGPADPADLLSQDTEFDIDGIGASWEEPAWLV